MMAATSQREDTVLIAGNAGFERKPTRGTRIGYGTGRVRERGFRTGDTGVSWRLQSSLFDGPGSRHRPGYPARRSGTLADYICDHPDRRHRDCYEMLYTRIAVM
ncbi:MAG: hypothetical protein KatS3mg054_0406 [Chloroflexus sp.]|nr:MAG: hypothetical protein KatS3mg054_0406 [Chloroflexus sp.]